MDARMTSISGIVPDFGAIFMSNQTTIQECFERKIFGLPHAFINFVNKVKAGMVLFLFEYEKRKLHGVFQAVTDGNVDIEPHAYHSSGKMYPAQVRFSVVWNCRPLFEHEFGDAIRDNYFSAYRFKFGLSKNQVQQLLGLFCSRKVEVQRSLTQKKAKRKCSKSLDEGNASVVCGKPALEDQDSMVESQVGNSVSGPQSHFADALPGLSFSGVLSMPFKSKSDNVVTFLDTTLSGLGDYIPLSSPEHFNPTETAMAFSETDAVKQNHLESAICDEYEDLPHSEESIIPMLFGTKDTNQPSSKYSPGKDQSKGYCKSSIIYQMESYPRVKGLYSDTSGERTSVFSRMKLVSTAAVEENEDDSVGLESVEGLMKKLQQSHKKWKKFTRKSKRIPHQKEDSSPKKRASVFSRLSFAPKYALGEKNNGNQLNKPRVADIFKGRNEKRKQYVWVRSQDACENTQVAIRGNLPQVIRTAGPISTNQSDVKAASYSCLLNVQMLSQESSVKERGGSCEGPDRSGDSQTVISPKDEVRRGNDFTEVSVKPLLTYQRRRLSASPSVKVLDNGTLENDGQSERKKICVGADGKGECGLGDAKELLFSPLTCEKLKMFGDELADGKPVVEI